MYGIVAISCPYIGLQCGGLDIRKGRPGDAEVQGLGGTIPVNRYVVQLEDPTEHALLMSVLHRDSL